MHTSWAALTYELYHLVEVVVDILDLADHGAYHAQVHDVLGRTRGEKAPLMLRRQNLIQKHE